MAGEATQRMRRIQSMRESRRSAETFETAVASIRALRSGHKLLSEERRRHYRNVVPVMLLLVGLVAWLLACVGIVVAMFSHIGDRFDFWVTRHTGIQVSLPIWFVSVSSAFYLVYLGITFYRVSGERDLARYGAMAGLIPIPFMLAALLGIPYRLWMSPAKALDPSSTFQFQVILLCFILGLGWEAYYFKQLSKLWYGVSEIVISVATTWYVVITAIPSLSALSHKSEHWVKLGAAAYLFSKGIGNTIEGLQETLPKRRFRAPTPALPQAATQETKGSEGEGTAAMDAPAALASVREAVMADAPTVADPKLNAAATPSQAGIARSEEPAIAAVSSLAPAEEGGIPQTNEGLAATEWIKTLAGLTPEEMCLLASKYESGLGLAKDEARASQLYEHAALAGNSKAMHQAGIAYNLGRGVPEDMSRAKAWYEAAAEAGEPRAMNSLGHMYLHGYGVTQDVAMAREWYERSVRAGDDDAMFELGSIYEDGTSVPQDFIRAREWYEKAIEAGHKQAMERMGIMYLEGHGVGKNIPEAIRWFERTVQDGWVYFDAPKYLIGLYVAGEYSNYALVKQVCEKLAGWNHLEGVMGLATLHYQGHGTPRDYEQALHWYERGAELACLEGVTQTARMYFEGIGTTVNGLRARSWFERAAQMGDYDSMVSLGRMCSRGEGGQQDFDLALQWLQTAAEAGDYYALYELGNLYKRRDWVGRDSRQAKGWYKKAAQTGSLRDKIAMQLLVWGERIGGSEKRAQRLVKQQVPASDSSVKAA